MNVKLPKILAFDDYHEISCLLIKLQELIGTTIKAKEINPEDYGFSFSTVATGLLYYGLFYTGKLPPKKKIAELLLKRVTNEGWEKPDMVYYRPIKLSKLF